MLDCKKKNMIVPFIAFHCASAIYIHYLRKQIHENLYILLNKCTELFDRHRIEYFVIGGTLLGAVRDKGIIPHDDDLDIGVIAGTLEDKSEFWDELKNDDILFFEKSSFRVAPRIYLKTEKLNVFMDIFEYDDAAEDDDKYALSCPRQKELWPMDWFAQNELYPLQKYGFGENGIVWGPCNPIPYLQRMYSGWRRTSTCTHIHLDQIVKQWSILDYGFIYYQKYVGRHVDNFLKRVGVFFTAPNSSQ
jgi:hypothetical protein